MPPITERFYRVMPMVEESVPIIPPSWARGVTSERPRRERQRQPIEFDGIHRHRCSFVAEDRSGHRGLTTRVLLDRPTAETVLGLIKSCLPRRFGELDYIYWQQAGIYFNRCELCGDLFDSSNHRLLCPSCNETHARCCWCDCFCLICDMQADNHEQFLCDSCRERDGVGVCVRCGYWREDLDEDDCCGNCARYCDGIHDHGYRPHPFNFLPPFVEAEYPRTLYIGVELETDKYSSSVGKRHCIEELTELGNKETLFHLKCDGSLTNGFEVVSQPATLDYHKNQFPWGRIIEIVKKGSGRSHDTDTCGLHIHFNFSFFGELRDSDENDLNATKLTFIFEKFWEQIKQFSRREDREIRDWARRYRELEEQNERGRWTNTGEVDGMEGKNIEIIKKAKGGDYDRYQAVNFCNHNTIEIRIFKGTLRLKTLYASLEFVDFLVRFVKQHSTMYLRKQTWDGLVSEILKHKKYQYLPAYLEERELCAKL